MGMFQRFLFGMEPKSDDPHYGSLAPFIDIYGRRNSRSGQTVNWKTALDVATVLACCKVIMEGVAQIPWRVYQDQGNGKRVAADHPLHHVIFRQPNMRQTSFEFRETLVLHTILCGNAYALKGMVGQNREVRELTPIEPGMMRVKQLDDQSLEYYVRGPNGNEIKVPADMIWHVRGPSWNTWMGLEAVHLAREAIGLAMTTEAAHSEFHKNGAKVSGVLSMEGAMSPEQFERLDKWLKKNLLGGENSNKPLIIDRGAKWASTQMTGVDAQHIETRKHQIEEICRGFRVMPIMVGHADKTATYASAEQMFLAHVIHTLAPWYERLEQSANINLLTAADQEAGFYTKFTANALMRGSAEARSQFYSRALGAGGSPAWMTPNEVRGLEELDPIKGGDELPKPTQAPPPAPPPA
jgi:HK97 family phage portal protein